MPRSHPPTPKHEDQWKESLRGPDVFPKPRSRSSSRDQQLRQPLLLSLPQAGEMTPAPESQYYVSVGGIQTSDSKASELVSAAATTSPPGMAAEEQQPIYRFEFDWQAQPDGCPPRQQRGPNFIVLSRAPAPALVERAEQMDMVIFQEIVGPLARLCAEVTSPAIRSQQILPQINNVLNFAGSLRNPAEINLAVAYVNDLIEEERKFLVKKGLHVNEDSLKQFLGQPQTAQQLDRLLQHINLEFVGDIRIKEKMRNHYGNWQFWWSMGLLLLTLASAFSTGLILHNNEHYKDNYKMVWEFIKTLGREGEFRFDNPSLISILTGLGTMLLGLATIEWKKHNALKRAPHVRNDLLTRGKTLASLEAIMMQLRSAEQAIQSRKQFIVEFSEPVVSAATSQKVDVLDVTAAVESGSAEVDLLTQAVESISFQSPGPAPYERGAMPSPQMMPIISPPPLRGIPSAAAARAEAHRQRASSRSRTPSPHSARTHTGTPSRPHTPSRSRSRSGTEVKV